MDPQMELARQLDTGDEEADCFSVYFTSIKVLGEGSFGKVIHGIAKATGEELAIKVISKRKMGEELLLRMKQEAVILEQLKHPNIVAFKAVRETNTRLLLAMELVQGGSLGMLMKTKKSFSEKEVSTLMRGLMQGLAYVHGQNIVHRDLKPENILISDVEDLSTVKIADFGLSSSFSLWTNKGLTEQCGTLLYMAPEFFVSRAYSKQIDIWSCGIIMYFFLDKGRHPFYDPKNDDSTSFKIKLASPKWTFPSHFSALAVNLLQKIALIDPTERYSAVQVLQHPFITANSKDSIPLTLQEQLNCLKTSEKLSQAVKMLMFLTFLRSAGEKSSIQTSKSQNIPQFDEKTSLFTFNNDFQQQNNSNEVSSILPKKITRKRLGSAISKCQRQQQQLDVNILGKIQETPLDLIVQFTSEKQPSTSWAQHTQSSKRRVVLPQNHVNNENITSESNEISRQMRIKSAVKTKPDITQTKELRRYSNIISHDQSESDRIIHKNNNNSSSYITNNNTLNSADKFSKEPFISATPSYHCQIKQPVFISPICANNQREKENKNIFKRQFQKSALSQYPPPSEESKGGYLTAKNHALSNNGLANHRTKTIASNQLVTEFSIKNECQSLRTIPIKNNIPLRTSVQLRNSDSRNGQYSKSQTRGDDNDIKQLQQYQQIFAVLPELKDKSLRIPTSQHTEREKNQGTAAKGYMQSTKSRLNHLFQMRIQL